MQSESVESMENETREKYSQQDLEKLRIRIEKYPKQVHVDILSILHRNNVTINELKDGSLINMNYIGEDVLEQIISYIDSYDKQQSELEAFEQKKNELCNLLSTDEWNSNPFVV